MAKDFRVELLRKYQHKAPGARVAVEIVERKTIDLEDEPLADWIRRGIGETQKQKMGRIEGIPLLAGRWIRPCSSCGREPAERMVIEWGEHRLCRGCFRKREKVRELYTKIKPTPRGNEVLKSSTQLAAFYTDRFIFTTLARYGEDRNFKIQLPQDFDTIGNSSRPRNYMGFIYADGNRMGEVVKRMPRLFPGSREGLQAYRAFSEIMDQATREAAVEAVLKEVEPDIFTTDDGEVRFIPAEFIMAGGDDLILAVPAHHALEVAISFIEKFQDKTRSLQQHYVESGDLAEPFAGCGLTTSAGLVLAHAHYPASDLMTLAGELMKLSKEKSARLAPRIENGVLAGEDTGTLDFMVLSESGSDPVKQRRRREYTQYAPTGKPICLTERPYTANEARRLLRIIRDLKGSKVPRTKLKALYAALFQSPLQAQFDALGLKERLYATGDLKEGSTLSWLVNDHLWNFPFRPAGGQQWTTPLTEIIELYDFIHGQKVEDQSSILTK